MKLKFALWDKKLMCERRKPQFLQSNIFFGKKVASKSLTARFLDTDIPRKIAAYQY